MFRSSQEQMPDLMRKRSGEHYCGGLLRQPAEGGHAIVVDEQLNPSFRFKAALPKTSLPRRDGARDSMAARNMTAGPCQLTSAAAFTQVILMPALWNIS
jgi:hypothetical protein